MLHAFIYKYITKNKILSLEKTSVFYFFSNMSLMFRLWLWIYLNILYNLVFQFSSHNTLANIFYRCKRNYKYLYNHFSNVFVNAEPY